MTLSFGFNLIPLCLDTWDNNISSPLQEITTDEEEHMYDEEEDDFDFHECKDEPDIITYSESGAAVQRWYQQMKYKQINEKMKNFNQFVCHMSDMDEFYTVVSAINK